MTSRYTSPSPDLRAWLLQRLVTHHTGAAQAITWRDLAAHARSAGWPVSGDERNLREEVNALQAEGGEKALIIATSGIAADRDQPAIPAGVFVAQTPAEVAACRRQLTSRVATLRERVATLDLAEQTVLRARVEQMRLI